MYYVERRIDRGQPFDSETQQKHGDWSDITWNLNLGWLDEQDFSLILHYTFKNHQIYLYA